MSSFRTGKGVDRMSIQSPKPLTAMATISENHSFSHFFSQLGQIHPLTPELQETLAQCITRECLPARTLLLEEGEVCERVYYLESGLARGFYRLGKEEITSWFVGAGSWMLAVTSFFTQKPSQEYIELLEESTLLSIDFASLERIYDQFHEFNFIGRVLTEHYYGMSEQRSWALRRQTAMERYHHLLRTDPGLFERVHLKHIASYLGMKRETLSRLRNKNEESGQ